MDLAALGSDRVAVRTHGGARGEKGTAALGAAGGLLHTAKIGLSFLMWYAFYVVYIIL